MRKNVSIADYSLNTIKKQAFKSFTSGNIYKSGISERSKIQAVGLRDEMEMSRIPLIGKITLKSPFLP